MGKIKEEMLNNLSEEDLEIINQINEEEQSRYEEWLQSEDYLDFGNDLLAESNLEFSMNDINSALKWAASAINTEPTEIGKDVYDILFIEKVEEHLNKIRYDKF